MSARASTLRGARAKGFKGREQLRALRLRRLERDLREMARKIRALESRFAEPLPIESQAPLRGVTAAPPGVPSPPSAVLAPFHKAERLASLPKAERIAPLPKAERIALPPVSGMEQLFTPKQGSAAPVAAQQEGEAMVYCGPCDHRVPTWFGADCITVACPLKSGPLKAKARQVRA